MSRIAASHFLIVGFLALSESAVPQTSCSESELLAATELVMPADMYTVDRIYMSDNSVKVTITASIEGRSMRPLAAFLRLTSGPDSVRIKPVTLSVSDDRKRAVSFRVNDTELRNIEVLFVIDALGEVSQSRCDKNVVKLIAHAV